jgi:serine O-acetyltransferase
MPTQKVARKLKSVDPVWDRIRSEAEEITREDTSLGGFIFTSVLNPGSFEEAMCHRLAQRLGNADIGAELIVQGFEDALEAEPEIGVAARADILAVYDRDPACHRYIDPLLYLKGFQALQTYRMSHRLYHMGRKDFAYYLQSRSSMIFGVDIHPGARIGRGIMIDHAHSIVIGETAVVEDDVSLLHSVTLGGTGKADGDRHPKVRHGVLIGAGRRSWAISKSGIARGWRQALSCCMTCRRTARLLVCPPRWLAMPDAASLPASWISCCL